MAEEEEKEVPQKKINLAPYIIILLIIGLLFFFWTPISAEINQLKTQLNLSNAFGGIEKPFTCLTDYSKCQEQFSYSESTVQSASKNYINVNFINTYVRANQSIKINSEIVAMNSLFDNLQMRASCFINNDSIIATPSLFNFPKSTIVQSSTLICSGDYRPGNNLIVKLTSDYKAETTLPAIIGGKDNLGKKVSEMSYDSPYKLSIGLNYNQPLKDGDYAMFIVLEKQQTSTLQNLKSLKISTLSQKATISCNDLQGLEVNELNRDSLKTFLIDPVKDKYLWQCTLTVANAGENPEDTYIQAEAIYTVESEYKTSLIVTK